MSKIISESWSEFVIEDYFEIVKGKRLTKANMKDGEIRFVGSSAYNNGITAYISNEDNRHKGNLITVCYNGSVGETFYQEEEFIASDDVNVLYPKFEMNKYIALFLCPIIKSKGKNYEFIDKWTKEKMGKTKILLPIDQNGEPDWFYMNNYMKSIELRVNNSLSRLRTASAYVKNKIETRDWISFDLTDLFVFSLPKGDIQVKKTKEGDMPLITPSNTNNGLVQRISDKSESTLYDANTITVDMFGNSYFHEEPYFVTAHGHVNVLKPKFMINKYIGLFMATTIKTMFLQKYGFSDMCTQKVLKVEKLYLPVDDNKKPNWSYIENYMSYVEEKVKQNISVLSK